jgi:hypothetical protein
MTKTLAEIAAQLEEPFALADIDLLPKSQIERDGKTMCMGLPFANPRVYQDRLNALAPGAWSTPPPIALTVGQKLVVYVTVIVCGVTHTDVGEAAAGGENAATESWAQGFKRACSQFGLGRYLYDLEKAWVPYDKQRKQIALDATGIQNIVRGMYNKAHVGESTPAPAISQVAQSAAPEPRAASTDHRITPAQIRSIKNLCNLLKREMAPDVETLSQQSASESIAELSKQWKQVQFKQQQKAS